eukprot:g1843.t1
MSSFPVDSEYSTTSFETSGSGTTATHSTSSTRSPKVSGSNSASRSKLSRTRTRNNSFGSSSGGGTRRRLSDAAITHRIETFLAAMQIKDNGENWAKREKALIDFQQLLSKVTTSSQGPNSSPSSVSDEIPHEWLTKDLCRQIVPPLTAQLKDLRSAIVRESCKLLTLFTKNLADDAAPIVSPILPHLLELCANGNKIISNYVDACLYEVVRNVRLPKTLARMVHHMEQNKSKDTRECCIKCVAIAFETYDSRVFQDAHDDGEPTDAANDLKDFIIHSLKDASSIARRYARQAFVEFSRHFPTVAKGLLSNMEKRTADPLKREIQKAEEERRMLERRASPSPGAPSSPPKKLNVKAPAPGANKVLSNSKAEVNSSEKKKKGSTRQSTPSRIPRTKTSKTLSSSKKKSESARTPTSSAQHTLPGIGARVFVKLKGQTSEALGTVRFCGDTDFRAGSWVGVELDDDLGKGDGIVQGKVYFSCEPGKGVFVRPTSIEVISLEEKSTEEKPASTKNNIRVGEKDLSISAQETNQADVQQVDPKKSIIHSITSVTKASTDGTVTDKPQNPTTSNVTYGFPTSQRVDFNPQPLIEASFRDLNMSAKTFENAMETGESILIRHRLHIDRVLSNLREEMATLAEFEALLGQHKENQEGKDAPTAEFELKCRNALTDYVYKIASGASRRHRFISEMPSTLFPSSTSAKKEEK